MGIQRKLKSLAAGLLIERPASKLTLAQITASLESTGQQVTQRMTAADDTPINRERACHMIGIERWGQRRLRVALGEPPVADEHDAYCPAPDLDWPELQAQFHATRQDTIALAHEVEEADAGDVRVFHNDFGDLSVRGWLRYLGNHADLESKRIE